MDPGLARTGLSGAAALLALLSASPEKPAAFWRLPVDVRSRATVIVSGEFVVDRGPCGFLPDGSRRWALLQGFRTKVVYHGEVRTDYIGVMGPRLWSSDGQGAELESGREYLVLIRPSRGTAKILKQREGSRRYQDALASDELIAIVEL